MTSLKPCRILHWCSVGGPSCGRGPVGIVQHGEERAGKVVGQRTAAVVIRRRNQTDQNQEQEEEQEEVKDDPQDPVQERLGGRGISPPISVWDQKFFDIKLKTLFLKESSGKVLLILHEFVPQKLDCCVNLNKVV